MPVSDGYVRFRLGSDGRYFFGNDEITIDELKRRYVDCSRRMEAIGLSRVRMQLLTDREVNGRLIQVPMVFYILSDFDTAMKEMADNP